MKRYANPRDTHICADLDSRGASEPPIVEFCKEPLSESLSLAIDVLKGVSDSNCVPKAPVRRTALFVPLGTDVDGELESPFLGTEPEANCPRYSLFTPPPLVDGELASPFPGAKPEGNCPLYSLFTLPPIVDFKVQRFSTESTPWAWPGRRLKGRSLCCSFASADLIAVELLSLCIVLGIPGLPSFSGKNFGDGGELTNMAGIGELGKLATPFVSVGIDAE
jgi:hypothetical protein